MADEEVVVKQAAEQQQQGEEDEVEELKGFDGLDSDEEHFQEQEEPLESEAPIDTRIFKMGWLKKKGGGKVQRGRHQGSLFARKNWKSRWFVLRDTVLKYYPFQTITGKEKAIGWVNIREGVSVDWDAAEPTRFSLTTDERVYSFVAPTPEAASEWVQQLTRSINRAELET
ncbi:hypothetical protein PTSG_07111 [Salpingoeca rosetta]|uniref:PH domain-containing protein n=1 Tax=Salpingoeca rosetta (strain ATCC 50818 / BSB-021) TaxID=946362 RepID=F2UE33_SALR5|nr:uncharacterized protein PTSG_07111 [Salpingoeca rosetta]EGD74883.1 hypothetical protein PTSG_07111 [Salpingoeca rosetta]|eukprot:XP_004992528.1 hypothetical protein PTSG_07111 [Salpingoeca rosetta]